MSHVGNRVQACAGIMWCIFVVYVHVRPLHKFEGAGALAFISNRTLHGLKQYKTYWIGLHQARQPLLPNNLPPPIQPNNFPELLTQCLLQAPHNVGVPGRDHSSSLKSPALNQVKIIRFSTLRPSQPSRVINLPYQPTNQPPPKPTSVIEYFQWGTDVLSQYM